MCLLPVMFVHSLQNKSCSISFLAHMFLKIKSCSNFLNAQMDAGILKSQNTFTCTMPFKIMPVNLPGQVDKKNTEKYCSAAGGRGCIVLKKGLMIL